jgi:hypothetical protein
MTREQIITAVWLPLTAHQETRLVAAADGDGRVTGGRLATRAKLVATQLARWEDPDNPRECVLTAAGYMYAEKLQKTWERYGR